MSIIIATALNFIFNFNVGIVGEIPQTLLLNDRLDITAIDFDTVKNLIFPCNQYCGTRTYREPFVRCERRQNEE